MGVVLDDNEGEMFREESQLSKGMLLQDTREEGSPIRSVCIINCANRSGRMSNRCKSSFGEDFSVYYL